MTPDEAQKTLYEAGFFTRWDNRVLYGGSEYKPGNPGVFDGRTFEVTLLRLGVCEARLTDFEGESALIDEGADGKKDLGSIVQRLIAMLDRNLEEPVKVPLWAAVELGRAAPETTNEVDALGSLWNTEGFSRLPPTPPPAGLTEEQRLELPEPERPRPRAAWAPLRQPFESSLPSAKGFDRASKHRRSYGAYGVGKHTCRTFHWAPLATRDSWPTKLRPLAPMSRLSDPFDMDTVNFVSAVRQALDWLPEWLELVVFSTEPVDGKLTASFFASKAEVPDSHHPEWLVALMTTKDR